MAEPGDTPRPSNQPPGGYLPRIARFEAPEDDEAPRKKKTKKEAERPEKDDPEAIPAFETVEGRKKARLIVGASSLGAVVLIGGSIFLFTRGGTSDETPDESNRLTTVTPNPPPPQSEDGARDLFRRAEEAAERGQSAQAVAFLEQVRTTYPKTKTAERAGEALDRERKGLPLFLEGALVTADRVEPPPQPPPEAVNVEPVEPVRVPTPTPVEVVPPTLVLGPKAPAGSALLRSSAAPRPLPAGFAALSEAGVHESGWPIAIVCERDGAIMVLVPGPNITLGRDNGPRNEGPARAVKLGTYYIDQHEVTNAQYDRYRQALSLPALPPPPKEKKEKGADEAPETIADRPVVMVTHGEASAYAAWAGKALPAEAQWEAAARTTDGRLYPWGADLPQWERPRAPRQVDPVFSFLRDMSPYGVFDMAGNVWEWTSDGYELKFYAGIKPGQANPIGPRHGPDWTVRGGSKDWTSTWREGMRQDKRLPYLGFRCVLAVEDVGPGQAAPGDPKSARGPVPF
jgi:formylglycine-generating enzyme required for sulfatase activity